MVFFIKKYTHKAHGRTEHSFEVFFCGSKVNFTIKKHIPNGAKTGLFDRILKNSANIGFNDRIFSFVPSHRTQLMAAYVFYAAPQVVCPPCGVWPTVSRPTTCCVSFRSKEKSKASDQPLELKKLIVFQRWWCSFHQIHVVLETHPFFSICLKEVKPSKKWAMGGILFLAQRAVFPLSGLSGSPPRVESTG